eukprot:SAG11_NODE_1921_length_4066_cov_4.386690_1_plen_135_part_00
MHTKFSLEAEVATAKAKREAATAADLLAEEAAADRGEARRGEAAGGDPLWRPEGCGRVRMFGSGSALIKCVRLNALMFGIESTYRRAKKKQPKHKTGTTLCVSSMGSHAVMIVGRSFFGRLFLWRPAFSTGVQL